MRSRRPWQDLVQEREGCQRGLAPRGPKNPAYTYHLRSFLLLGVLGGVSKGGVVKGGMGGGGITFGF